MEIHPIYHQFFSDQGGAVGDWTPFKNYRALREEPLALDFSISLERSWGDVAKEIAWIALQVILFPWGLYELAKALIHRIAMLMIYPAQLISRTYNDRQR